MEFLNEFLRASGIEIHFGYALIYLLLVVLGAFGNVANVVYVKRECTSFKAYFKSKPKATVMMVIGVLGGWIGLLQISETSLYTYVMTGFICDSVFNRFAGGQEAVAKLDVVGAGRSKE